MHRNAMLMVFLRDLLYVDKVPEFVQKDSFKTNWNPLCFLQSKALCAPK